MDFCVVHPLKGKVAIYFFLFCKKIMPRDLGLCPDRYEILFFSQKKRISLKIYDHLLKKKHSGKL